MDRAVLDAALQLGFPCGGWCPEGRLAEDGRIPDKYPLSELAEGGYRQRTLRNVLDSDGTTILYFDQLEGGTKETAVFCGRHGKPYKLIDGTQIAASDAADLIHCFVEENRIGTLNVAGPRASKQPAIYAYAYDVITRLLVRMRSREQ